tara:strand:- start:255 stop:1487 length:1233 start_codon:yes stop_codon:yes gene_type:complete
MILNEKKKIFFFYLFLYLTLLVSFFFQENTTGGAEFDFRIISNAIKSFSNDLKYTLKNYHLFEISHFPFYYIFLSFFYNDYLNFFLIKIIILHLSLFLPFVFYKLLSFNFDFQNKYLIYIPGILFLSPSYRTSAVWGLNDNLALIFLGLSILFFLKFSEGKKNKKKIFIILNILFLALAAYLRQYYAIFTIFFLYQILKQRDFNILLTYIFTNIILSLPAIFSVYNSSNLNYSLNFFSIDFINNFFLILTIFFIYLIPIYAEKKNVYGLYNFYNKRKILVFLIFFITILLSFFFDYEVNYGGGIIYKLFYNPQIKYLFYFVAYIAFLLIFHFIYLNYKNNFIIILTLLFMFPLFHVYQKYLDPLSIILILCLFKNELITNFINNLRINIKVFYLYFFLIYIGSLSYRIII